jgi:hypothetical protein
MRLRSLALGVSASLVLASLASPPARAQSDADRATARQLGQDGEDALEKKDWKRAEDDFRRADSLIHAPTLMLGLARSLAGEDRFVEAQEAYNRIVREGVSPSAPDAFKKAVDDAKKEVDAVSAKIGSVVITVTASGGGDMPGLQVLLDDKSVNPASLGVKRAVDPGNHTLKVTATGFKDANLTFKVADGGAVNEPVTLEKGLAVGPTPSASASASAIPTSSATTEPTTTASVDTGTPAPKKSILPWIAFGVGGAGLIFGGITGGLAIGKHSTLAGECNNGVCPPADQSDLDSYHLMGTLSTVGFIVGAVGVTAGVILLFVHPGKSESPAPAATTTATAGIEVQPVVGLGTIGAVGRF